uniref:Retrotransposon gag domain-containing protein n=1 Tax=Cajanus cajan TaxID=3821 RepID=A0A151SSE2_CAJCA|nr:hypothetical protein KK1_003945 [Cajanus cajan]
MEDRLAARLETRLIELTGNIKKALDESLKNSIQEVFRSSHEGNDSHHSSGSATQHKGSHPHSSYGTRLARIDFPKFGGDNVHQWIYQAENYFSIDNTPNDVKVKIAIIHLEGKALQWHTAFVRSAGNFPIHNWAAYTNLLIDRFGAVCDDPMAELMKLRQTTSVEKYHEDFDAIVARLQLSEEHKSECLNRNCQF